MVISNEVIEGCHTTCLTGCSWTRAERIPGVGSRVQIQTILERVWSTVARRLPFSGLNVMIDTPRCGPEGSGTMADAEWVGVPAYSRSYSVFV